MCQCRQELTGKELEFLPLTWRNHIEYLVTNLRCTATQSQQQPLFMCYLWPQVCFLLMWQSTWYQETCREEKAPPACAFEALMSKNWWLHLAKASCCVSMWQKNRKAYRQVSRKQNSRGNFTWWELPLIVTTPIPGELHSFLWIAYLPLKGSINLPGC